MEMDHSMMPTLWNYGSYNQQLHPRYYYDHHRQIPAHQHPSHRYQTPDATVSPIFVKSPQSYCTINYMQTPSAVATEAACDAWKAVGAGTGADRPCPAAVAGRVLGRATGSMAAASRVWSSYPEFGV